MKVALIQAPRWSIVTPSYAVALLTGNLRSRGHTVFPRHFDVDFYEAVSDEEKQLWLNESAKFWNNRASVEGMISDYASVLDRMADEVCGVEPQLVGFAQKPVPPPLLHHRGHDLLVFAVVLLLLMVVPTMLYSHFQAKAEGSK